MDSIRKVLGAIRLTVIWVGLSVVVTVEQANAIESRSIRELRWVVDESALFNSYQARPVECLKKVTGARRQAQMLGRIAFNSPRLLGGQAGRMGLSCASCHVNGRNNPYFYVKQISDRPGNADISHSFLSSQGGDQTFNPVPIPDLAERQNLRFPKRLGTEFTKTLVKLVEIEFDGQPASQSVYRALQIYLQDTDISHCDIEDVEKPASLDMDWRLLAAAYEWLAKSVGRSKNDFDRRLVVNSARSYLERIYENYGLEINQKLDQDLFDLSQMFYDLTNPMSEEDVAEHLRSIQNNMVLLKSNLTTHEHQSAYHSDFLKQSFRFNKH